MRKNMIERRKALGMTQLETAKLLGCSRSTYASYETGAIAPSLEMGFKIKEVLEYEGDDIFLNTDVNINDNTGTA